MPDDCAAGRNEPSFQLPRWETVTSDSRKIQTTMKALNLILAAILITLIRPLAAAAGDPVAAPAPPHMTADGFSFAAGGDLLGFYHPVTAVADAELKKISELMRQSDAGYANREGNVFDLATFKGAPGAETGGFSCRTGSSSRATR